MIHLTRSAYDDIIYHAYEGEDKEICGVLAGRYGEETSQADTIYRAENVAETPQLRYLIDPEEQFEIIEAIEDAGDDIVGFYHSHPTGGSTPSETDAARATWPDHSYVICALNGYPFVGSWRWRGDAETFEQETVRVE